MSTVRLTTTKLVLALVNIILILIGHTAEATPPTPPAELRIIDREVIVKLKPFKEAFVIPVQVVVNQDVSKLVIQVRVFSTDPIKPVELAQSKHPVNAKEKTGKLKIKVPQQRNGARYKVLIELVGSVGKRRGIFDKEVLFQVTEHDRQQLMTPPDLRQLDQQRREDAFQNRLREVPDRPDIRLLAADTVRVPDELAATAKPLADRPQLLVRGKGPPEAIRRHVVDHAGKSWRPRDPITVRGRLVYLDFEGTWRPLVTVSVSLFDLESLSSEYLGNTTTDENGEWSFSVDNFDGFHEGGRDIFYIFQLNNDRWNVADANGFPHVWTSAVHYDLLEGTVLDFGDETGILDPEAMQVWGIINLAWNHITEVGGQDPGDIVVRYPTVDSEFQQTTVPVYIAIAAEDNSAPDVILHEYGHALMYLAQGSTPLAGDKNHGFDVEVDPPVAYSEGWASAFALSVCPDGQYNFSEGTSENVDEWPTCTSQFDYGQPLEQFDLFLNGALRDGYANEGRVAAAINDFLDLPDDNNLGNEDLGQNGKEDANSTDRISLATIYRDSMWGFLHENFLGLFSTLRGNLPGGAARDLTDDIIEYNWILGEVSEECVASKVAAALLDEPQPVLSGLRAFRDYGLKPTSSGRRWIQSYYSHSPEIAMLLIGDEKVRRSALSVVKHFSMLGQALSQHQELERLLDKNQQVLPRDVSSAIESIVALIEKKGSTELRQELGALRQELKSLEGMSLADAIRRPEGGTGAAKGGVLPIIRPAALSPASKKADWALIRKNLPKDKNNN